MGSLPPVSFISSVFQVFIREHFTCIWVVVFLILNCRKWPVSTFHDATVVVFFFDCDRVIVDRELQGPAAFAVSRAWHGTSRQKLYDELGRENLYHRRWYRRMTHFYKLQSTRLPLHLDNLIPANGDLNYNLRTPYDYDQHIERTTRFSHTYFQNWVSEWNRLDVSIRSTQ